MNKKYIYIILGIFLILGIYLRTGMLDAPAINYHNMKSSEYLAEAKLMISNPDTCLLHRCTYLFWGLQPGQFGEEGSGFFSEYIQLPIIPWLTAIGWKIVGSEPIWLPRLIIIAFSIAAILAMYLLMKRLTDNEYLSLLTSGLFTIMPLGIYFGGQAILPEMPALFFTILAIYFYLGWIKSFRKKDLFFSMLSVSMAGLLKETFLIVLVPLAIITPWKEVWNKKDQWLFAIGGLSLYVIIQQLYTFITIDKSKILSESVVISFSRLISSSFWASTIPSLKSYISDNFTFWFFFLAIGGIIFACTKYKTLIGRLTIGYIISLIFYCGILSGKIGGHSYYQMPYLPLVCITSAYFLFNLGHIIKQFVNIKHIEYISLILIICAIPSMQAANDRVFGTVFFGQDVAGEYIKDHTTPDERIFIYGHSQTFATCTFAERRCGQPYKENISIQSMEGNGNFSIENDPYNVRYLTFDQYGLSLLQNEYAKDWKYIENNYHLVWLGAIPQNNQLVPYLFILKKGGTLNMSNIQATPYIATTYHMSYGDIPFYVAELE
jgi:hypothetical protein